MSHWERLAAQNPAYAESDYQKAGYRLVMEQVLYASDPRSRIAYELVVRHRKEYETLLTQLGISMVHNPHLGYLVATPSQYVAEKMRLTETRLALVLRRLYDDKMHATEIVAGEAFVDMIELERAYKDLLNRELPVTSALNEQLQAMKRYGIVRLEDSRDEQRVQLAIRPGIVDVLGETALLQLAAHAVSQEEEDADEAA
ncbi:MULTISPECIES: DUF4194 domain-containing protein [unclassified Lysobacter]|uniref:DUF4194 domain-containing protein n=1 Tax=unclassified Lysobacter TaxID=2635362 RepID=UPI001BE58554|nr:MULTISPECIES: DUF4194 domain-containing protein [unclassified Lysobacter]MBT2748646.1 DUF4194 domain-containing protein [Lysobacter sp. ISL-42]MBT2751581.1 DUF4194 domain-containing protein [Lysobacter sp. ISL-50]MBT2775775.1 DUF4194 domain-containing protein [Lysobacter sp. ISL-54]MBT2782260.1 DUF4194 domain-containing protein [Lysobacter sp. ISL-52]